MKKILLIAILFTIVSSCSKNDPQPSTATPPPSTQQTWNGLYCISFIKRTVVSATYITYDTLGKMCGNDSVMQYYNYNNPYPFAGANGHCGKKIYQCSQCK